MSIIHFNFSSLKARLLSNLPFKGIHQVPLPVRCATSCRLWAKNVVFLNSVCRAVLRSFLIPRCREFFLCFCLAQNRSIPRGYSHWKSNNFVEQWTSKRRLRIGLACAMAFLSLASPGAPWLVGWCSAQRLIVRDDSFRLIPYSGWLPSYQLLTLYANHQVVFRKIDASKWLLLPRSLYPSQMKVDSCAEVHLWSCKWSQGIWNPFRSSFDKACTLHQTVLSCTCGEIHLSDSHWCSERGKIWWSKWHEKRTVRIEDVCAWSAGKAGFHAYGCGCV